jgi:hypothetical protein
MNNRMLLQPGLCHVDSFLRLIQCATMKKRIIWLSVLCLLLGGLSTVNNQLLAAELSRQQMLRTPDKIPEWIAQKKINYAQIPNPHWNNNDCMGCHRNTPVGRQLYLRGKSIDELCEYCHSGKFDHSYIHPSGVSLNADMRKRIPKEFAANLDPGKRVTCATCHEIEAQCLAKRRNERQINPLFLRNGPYRGRTEICYKCHDNSGYQRRNAHDQIGDDGKIKEYTCLICHDKTKGLEKANSIREVGFNVKDNLVWVCSGCHPLTPHPSGSFTMTTRGVPNHLVIPPEPIRSKMLQSEKAQHVSMPLDPITGRVFCGTCHNPHEKGVIKNQAAAKGADEKKRLRTNNICMNCHDK